MDLTGKRVVVTRPLSQSAHFTRLLELQGAQPVLFPVIDIHPPDDYQPLDRALEKLSCYEWLVLTSVNGVQAVWERFDSIGVREFPSEVKVAAIGPKTAGVLEARGVSPAFVPEHYIAEAIVPGLGDIRDRWVLLPRAELARPALPRAIQNAGGIAHEIVAYRTLPANVDDAQLRLLVGGVDILTFTSPSTVRNFKKLVGESGLDPVILPGNPIVACIGPITSEAAAEEGFDVSVVAENYTTEGLVEALIRYG